jgi:hypothetical protein
MPIEEIVPVEDAQLRAILDTGVESPVDYRADGSFSFPVDYHGQPYRVLVTLGAVTSEWQHSGSTIAIGATTAGRYDVRPVAQTAVTLTNYVPVAATQPAIITSTGVFTQTSTAMFGPTVSFDWRLATPALGSLPGMLDASKHDRIYAYEQEGATDGNSPPYSRIRALSQDSITQAPASSTTLPQLAPVAANVCMRMTGNAGAEKTRLTVTHPRNYLREAGSWFAYSVPAPDWVGLSGAIHSAVCGFDGPRDLDIAPVFHDPYRGTTLMANANTILYFLTQLPGTAASAELANITRVYRTAERGDPASCTSVVAQVDATVGLPGAFLLDGETLNFDNEEIELDLTRAPTLSWQVLAEGTIDFTSVALHELQSISNVTTVVRRWAATTVGTSARIEPSMLEVGHTYLFAVTAGRGRPHAPDGDYVTIAQPIENSTIWTFTFIVRGPS